MENMTNKENLFFDPATGKLCTSRPANDKAIAVDMNKQGSGGFFATCSFIVEREGNEVINFATIIGDLASFPSCVC